MKKGILSLLVLISLSASAQNYDSTAKKAEAVTNAQQQEKVFILVGTETQFKFLETLLSQTVLPIPLTQGFSLLQWLGSRQQFQEPTKSVPKK